MDEVKLTTREQEFWEGIRMNEPILHIQRCEDAAKSLITLITILAALFTGIVATSKAFERLVGTPLLLIFLIPLGIWLVSLYLASYIIVPRRYTHGEGEDIQEQYESIRPVKHRVLKWGYGLLIASMVFLFTEGVYFLVVAPGNVP